MIGLTGRKHWTVKTIKTTETHVAANSRREAEEIATKLHWHRETSTRVVITLCPPDCQGNL